MKSILRLIYIFLFSAASPAWAHSICQYLNNEAQCHEYAECVWIPDANNSGQCVYEKGFPKTANLSIERQIVRGIGTADTEEGAKANAVDAEDRCHASVSQTSAWEVRWFTFTRDMSNTTTSRHKRDLPAKLTGKNDHPDEEHKAIGLGYFSLLLC